MEMQFKNEIKKLADIVVWADNLITAAGFDVEKYKNDAASAYCHVKAYELWKIKTVVLESMERHTVYTNAFNPDIVDKDAKIELLEKEIEGRKEGYHALKEKMDELKEELADCKVKIRHQKENLDGINKTLEIRTKENERLIAVKNNQYKEIEAHESENARLSERIIELKRSFNSLKEEMANRYIPIETHNDICKTYEINDTSLKKQVEYLKKELDQTCACKELDLKGHQSRETALVNALADKNDEIKKLKEERDKHMARVNDLRMELDCLKASKEKHEEAARDKTIEDLRESFNYWRTKCLAAQEEIEKLKKEEDDHGRAGFKRYIEYLIEEEERAVPERFKARLNEEITAIFEKEEETEVKGAGRTSSGRYPWGAEVNDAKEPIIFDEYHKYNWFPCGEDSIE